jgi:hypothetical protein
MHMRHAEQFVARPLNCGVKGLQVPIHPRAVLTASIAAMLYLTLPSQSSLPAKATAALECPAVLATKVIAEKYREWSVYSNDPLRLTCADIAYYVDNDDATLDSDARRN